MAQGTAERLWQVSLHPWLHEIVLLGSWREGSEVAAARVIFRLRGYADGLNRCCIANNTLILVAVTTAYLLLAAVTTAYVFTGGGDNRYFFYWRR